MVVPRGPWMIDLRHAMAAVDPPGERGRAGGDPLVSTPARAAPPANGTRGLVAAQVARVGRRCRATTRPSGIRRRR